MAEYPLDRTMKLLTVGVAAIMLVGILFFQASSEEGDTRPFNVYFDVGEPIIVSESGYAPEGDTQTHVISVDKTELLAVVVGLEWDDDVEDFVSGQPNDDFTLTIEGPAGANVTYPLGKSVSGDSGSLGLVGSLRSELPENATVVAASPEEVEAQYLSDNGVGDWTITVTCDNAGDDGLPFGQSDSGNDYTLTILVDFYTINVQEVSEAA